MHIDYNKILGLGIILGLLGCAGMDMKQGGFPEKGWGFPPEVIRKGNPEGVKEKNFFYNTYTVKIDSKDAKETSQVEKECTEKAKKEFSDDLVSDMVSEIVEHSPVIKHKPMTGGPFGCKVF
jgi:hypothetical protein